MTLTPRRFVLFLVLFLVPAPAFSQDFSGPYLGIEAARQHYIGGSLVNGVDTLQQDSRLVVSLAAGLRLQVRRFVFGGELGRGRADGDLRLEDAGLTIDYLNGSQGHWQLHAGPTIGTRTLIFGYLSEVTREFDVTVAVAGQTIEQEDEQGMLRFGVGVEQQVTNRLRLRFAAGTSRADFGDRPTNVEIKKRLELSGGLVIQF